MADGTGKNKRKKIIFFTILFILTILCIFFINYFSSKYNLKEASSIGIIGGADGPTAIYIVGNQNWENILLYLLIVICFNILAVILLFSSISVILLFINIIIIIAFIVKTIYDKRKKKD